MHRDRKEATYLRACLYRRQGHLSMKTVTMIAQKHADLAGMASVTTTLIDVGPPRLMRWAACLIRS